MFFELFALLENYVNLWRQTPQEQIVSNFIPLREIKLDSFAVMAITFFLVQTTGHVIFMILYGCN